MLAFKKLFSDTNDSIVMYVFLLVVLVQTIYPITLDNSTESYFIYNILYAMLILSGVLVARNSPILMRIAMLVGGLWLITGLAIAFFLDLRDISVGYFLGFIMISIFQLVVIKVLFTYIFSATMVTRDVILAAIAIYWLLGGFFGTLFGILEAVTFLQTGTNAFIDGQLGVTGSATPWQSTLYYSYATLTTLGYGDVLPVSPWARSLASVESIVGVMYTTIIMARLVGVYMADSEITPLKRENQERVI